MKCATHPTLDAIAACPMCGKTICEACRVNVNNLPHCKTCAEWVISQIVGAPFGPMGVPHPRGIPRKELFIMGGVGSLIMLGTSLITGFYILGGSYWSVGFIFNILAIFSIGMGITGVGFLGFYKNYGSTMGLITFVFSLIISFFFFLTVFGSVYHYDYYFSIILIFIAAGLNLGLTGATLIVVRNFTTQHGLSLSAGILNIFSAMTFVTLIGVLNYGIGWFLLAAASVLTALVFYLAKLPPVGAGGSPYPPQQAQPPGLHEEITLKPPIWNPP